MCAKRTVSPKAPTQCTFGERGGTRKRADDGFGSPAKALLLWGKGAAADQVKPCFLHKNTANQKARRDVVECSYRTYPQTQ